MLKRLFQIISTCLKYAFSKKPRPVRVRLFFEQLGGAFVKFGQILALRSDLIAEDVAFELLNLLDRMPEFSPQEVRQKIRRKLGREVEQLFPEFDFTPLAAASFAQIHSAKLSSGQKVIVKIQRPGIEGTVKVDLLLLRLAGRLIDTFGFKGPIKARQIVEEFAEWTWQELDYRLEGQAAEQLALQQADFPGINFPKIFWQYTRRQILVEEFIEGVNLKEILMGNLPASFNPELVSERLIENAMHQYFLFGRFHGDPHPGNILVDQQNNIGVVDFGIMGQSQELARIAMANFAAATMEKNYPEAITGFFHLGIARRLAQDLPYFLEDEKFAALFMRAFAAFKQIMTRRFASLAERWHRALTDPDASFRQKSAASTFLEFLSLASQYRVVLGREIVMFIKTLIAVDAISLKINPKFNLPKAVSEVFAREEYSRFFSAEAKEKLSQVLKPLREQATRDRERAGLLEDYYRDWFERIMERHEEEFYELIKDQEEQAKQKRVEEARLSGLPDWIVAMHQTLGHNEKFNL